MRIFSRMFSDIALTISFIFLICSPYPAIAAPISSIVGTIFDKDSKKTLPLYDFLVTNEKPSPSEILVKSFFRNKKTGVLEVSEEVRYESGKLISYKMFQNQIHEIGTAELKENRIFFKKQKIDKDGKLSTIKTDDEKLEPNTIVMDQLEELLHQHWAELIAGENIEARFIAVSRLETVGFKFFVDEEVLYMGKPALMIKMKATAFFVSLFFKPIIFYFEKEGGHHLLEVIGRMPVKEKTGEDDWSDIEANLVIQKRIPGELTRY